MMTRHVRITIFMTISPLLLGTPACKSKAAEMPTEHIVKAMYGAIANELPDKALAYLQELDRRYERVDWQRGEDTPIYYAVRGAKPEALQVLWPLEKGTPIYYAVYRAKPEVLQALLDADIPLLKPTRTKEELSKLLTNATFADKPKDEQLLLLLLKHGADPNFPQDSAGETIWHVTAGYKSTRLLRFLLEKVDKPGLNLVDKNGQRPLHSAARRPDTLALLTQHGATTGKPFLDDCALSTKKALQMLQEENSLADATDGAGWTGLHWAAVRSEVDLAKALLAKDSSPVKENNAGRTPLELACDAGATEIVALFLADKRVDAKGELAYPCLRAAIEAHSPGIVALFLKAGAAPGGYKKHRGLLHLAADEGQNEIIRLLLEQGADVNVREEMSQQTALHRAAFHAPSSTLRLLLGAGARKNIRDMHGTLPYDIAQSLQREDDILSLLRPD